MSAEIPDEITVIRVDFDLIIGIIIAIKVRGIANFKPSSSGTNEPNIITANVEISQQTQSVLPVPIKW